MNSVFVPRGKGNLAAYVSVNSDATSPDFGKMKVLEVTDVNAPGPGQVANELSQDDAVVEALTGLRVQGAPPPVFGNLLTLPVAEGMVHIEPVYAVRAGGASSFPILQHVIVYYNGDVGIGTTLVDALRNALGVEEGSGGGPVVEPDGGGGEGDGGEQPPRGSLDDRIADLLDQADQIFRDAEAAQAEGDTVKWARLMEKGKDLVSDALTLANQRPERGSGNGQGAGDE